MGEKGVSLIMDGQNIFSYSHSTLILIKRQKKRQMTKNDEFLVTCHLTLKMSIV